MAIQNNTASAVNAMDQIVEIVKKANDLAQGIAAAVEEQSATTGEIAQNIAQTASTSSEVNADAGPRGVHQRRNYCQYV